MGLDTSHDCWHGAYSAFGRWRAGLAKAAGIPLDLMVGHWDTERWDAVATLVQRLEPPSPFSPGPGGGFIATRESLTISLAAIGQMAPEVSTMQRALDTLLPWLPLRWEELRPDILHVLLHHSDCDGEIAAADCGPLADRLETLLPLLPTEPDGGHIGDWRVKTQKFIDGLRLAASLGEAVDFH